MRLDRRAVALLTVATLMGAPTALAHTPGQGGPSSAGELFEQRAMTAFQSAGAAGVVQRAVPRADCGPGSTPETDIQGRVPADVPATGFNCNMTLLGREGNAGGFKVERFVDKAGHECAFYDTTLFFPSNIQDLSDEPTGGAVVDVSDPANPVRTATLVTPAMQTPHESLVLNARRGLLVAVMGNATAYPGVVDIYDVNEDCRNPALQSSLPVGLLGHESGFAPDGNTFYATSLFSGQVTAVDVTDPKLPKPVWVGQYRSHGMNVSNDGNRLYFAALDGLIIVDSSEIQARKPNPQVHEISRLTWPEMTIPQNAIPVTIGGKPYLVEVDEFAGSAESNGPVANGSKVGAARIIDIADERAPRVVSNIRLEVNEPENRERVADDPGASSLLQGYAGHYCAVPQREEPGIVACSFIASGLRVFDIRDPERPKEIGYFTTPAGQARNPGPPSNFAMSAPAFDPENGEIWYADGNTGFYALRMTGGVWPFPRGANCADRRAPETTLRRGGIRITRSGVTLRGGAREVGDCRSGVQRVQVSLARVSGRTGVNCRFLTRPDRYRLTRPQNCRRPVLFTARGTGNWSFRFPVRLRPGRYRMQVRSTDVARNKERPTRGRNMVSFGVR